MPSIFFANSERKGDDLDSYRLSSPPLSESSVGSVFLMGLLSSFDHWIVSPVSLELLSVVRPALFSFRVLG